MSDSVIKVRLKRPGIPDELITVQGDVVTVGRSMDCDIRVDQPYVSKRHLRIYRGYVVIDLGSRNGTFIEGVRVSEPTLLDGSRICLGDEDAVLEIEREDDVGSAPATDGENAELERLRRRNQELTNLVMHLEDELADARSSDPELAETVEIRQELQNRIEELESTKLKKLAGGASAGLAELEEENRRQLEALKRVEEELERARRQLEDLGGQDG